MTAIRHLCGRYTERKIRQYSETNISYCNRRKILSSFEVLPNDIKTLSLKVRGKRGSGREGRERGEWKRRGVEKRIVGEGED